MKLPMKILSTGILAIILLDTTSADKIKPEDKTPVAKIGLAESINSEGLKIRIFKNATARPLPAISIEKKIKTVYDDTLEYYKILDFWTHDQYVGSWGCRDGMLTIYKVLYNAPPFKDEIIIRDNYEI
ncbi:MAG: hypothetical protein WCS96_13635, partial [Victivallales bacterium]